MNEVLRKCMPSHLRFSFGLPYELFSCFLTGSPVLSQYRVSTVKKRAKQPSLLPLSPITPGWYILINLFMTSILFEKFCYNDSKCNSN